MEKYCIYIFTNNRPKQLERLLEEMLDFHYEYDVFVIDDSYSTEIVNENQILTNKYNFAKYLGKKSYLEFYNKQDNPQEKDVLGTKNWNLGIARNYALDYAINYGYDKILFIDDDISGIEVGLIVNGFKKLTKDTFVSCNIKGLEDNSIVGHIASKVGILDNGPKMLSGGFLFLTPNSILHKFYNIYNEDWILQLLEKEKKRIIIEYSVTHNVDKDIQWTLEQALFQELGELIVEGLLENSNAFYLNYTFWDEILENRIKFIEEINVASLKANYRFGCEICSNIIEWLKQHNGISLQQLVKQNLIEYYEHKI